MASCQGCAALVWAEANLLFWEEAHSYLALYAFSRLEAHEPRFTLQIVQFVCLAAPGDYCAKRAKWKLFLHLLVCIILHVNLWKAEKIYGLIFVCQLGQFHATGFANICR